MASGGRRGLDPDNAPRQHGSMSTTQRSTFRPTVWPAEPPETPPVERWRLEPVAGVDSAWNLHGAGFTELPTDFTFRELLTQVVVTDEDVLAFTEAWGLAGDASTWHYVQHPPRSLMPVVRETARWNREVVEGLVHLDAVRFHLAVLRSLARHLLAYLEHDSEADVVSIWADEGAFAPRTAGDAWTLWKKLLDRGLSTFAVHIRLASDDDAAGRPMPTSLYSCVCLELARYLTSATKTTVQRCANDRCRQPFTKQRGRSQFGQHRSTGVRFCSPLCAKAQSERDRRVRRRQEKGQDQ